MDIIDSIVYCDFDQPKCNGYTTDFNDGNFENNIYAAIAGTGIKKTTWIVAIYTMTLIINSKILFYTYCLQLLISNW